MLPTRLNVLPPDKKKNLQRMIRNEFIRSNLAIGIIVASIIGIALLGGKSILESYFADLSETITAVTVQTKDKNMKIEQANSRIKTANQVLNTYTYWPTILADITNVVPNEIMVHSLSMNLETKEGTIAGISATRDALLAFGESLRALELVHIVDIPISQLTERENVTFTLRFRFEP